VRTVSLRRIPAFYGEITLTYARVEQTNIYIMFIMSQTSIVDVHLITTTESPGGGGDRAATTQARALRRKDRVQQPRRRCSLPINTAQRRSDEVSTRTRAW
jgi:isoquinoline 1-oxidoreductase subunit beta